MDKKIIQEPANVLTDEDLNTLYFTANERSKSGLINNYALDDMYKLVASHRELNNRNRKLVHENDELLAENEKMRGAIDALQQQMWEGI